MSELVLAVLMFLALFGLAMFVPTLYSIWLFCLASDRQFNRVYAKIRARNVDWRRWRTR